MFKHYHYTKLELTDCLGHKEQQALYILLKGPWGPHSLTKVACICLRMCKWSGPIICLGYKETASPIAYHKKLQKVAICD